MHIKNTPIFLSNCHLFNLIDINKIITVANNVTEEYFRPIIYKFYFRMRVLYFSNFLFTFTFDFNI
jgi:hypothetical protein